MTARERLEEYLRDQQVPFTVQYHRPAFTAQDVAASEHLPGDMVAKVLMVYVDGELVMLVLPASHRADLVKVAAALGASDVRLAEERDFAARFRDCDIGAMPPFGRLYGVPVYADQTLSEDEMIVFQAGTHTETITMAYADYARLANPTVVNIARDARALGGHF